ncbi:MAG TPA: D-aminoacyl-tRNA deacylase [Candidatus Izemoplasmatales bacterium]|nr:D-aminoacyl-tRNA deacylase [Candidatus Izemoplasmatales bacterium]
MKVVIQRVKRAQVSVENGPVACIDQGLVVLVGMKKDDDLKKVLHVADKISKLRIFSDKQGLMNLNIHQVKGQILSVSQFTLYGDVKKQNRPGFSNAMAYQEAEPLYHQFNDQLKSHQIDVQEGVFGENMDILLVNDGPVTIIIDTDQ